MRYTLAVALVTASAEANVTNPKPRELPVFVSNKTTASVTSPHWEKNSRRSGSRTELASPPTNTFVLVGFVITRA